MDLVRNLISVGRMVREETKIKVRQPLSEILLDGKNKEVIDELTELIKEELNVKKITYVDNLNDYMNLTVKPNFRKVGRVLGSKIKSFGKALENLTNEDITKIENNEEFIIDLEGEPLSVTKDMIEVRFSSKEGLDVGMHDNDFVILNTTITEELILEGLAREFISKIQNIRKEKDFNVTDRININYNGNDLIKNMIKTFDSYIKEETLALDILFKEKIEESTLINEHEVFIEIEKAN